MAIKPERIKARLRVLFPKANLSNKRLDEISARLAKKPADDAEDDAVDAVINDANDFMPFEDIAKEDDRIRTLEAKANNQKTPEEIAAEQKAKADEEAAKKAKEDALNEAPTWFKTFSEDIEKKIGGMSQSIQDIKSGKETESKQQRISKLFEDSEVLKSLPEKIQQRAMKTIDLESETSLEDQVLQLSEDFKGFTQSAADQKQYAGNPGKSFNDTKPSDEELEDVADAL